MPRRMLLAVPRVIDCQGRKDALITRPSKLGKNPHTDPLFACSPVRKHRGSITLS